MNEPSRKTSDHQHRLVLSFSVFVTTCIGLPIMFNWESLPTIDAAALEDPQMILKLLLRGFVGILPFLPVLVYANLFIPRGSKVKSVAITSASVAAAMMMGCFVTVGIVMAMRGDPDSGNAPSPRPGVGRMVLLVIVGFALMFGMTFALLMGASRKRRKA